MLNLVAGVLLMVVTRTHGFACISNNLNSFQGSSSSAQTAAAVSPMPTPSLNLEATWSRTKSTAQRGRPFIMSSAEGAENAQSLRMQTPGDGSGDNPPDAYEQAEADVVSSPASTVFVAGGSGFVGAEICSQLLEAGCNVIALSRKGAPKDEGSWVKSVKWVEANALNQEAYRAELRKSDTVVSCVGGLGKTDAYMGLINGEANIKLAEAAADAGVKQFIFVSVHDYRTPQFVKRVGYFDGKRRTEKVVGDLFGSKGIILKPAFIYGERKVTIKGPNGMKRGFKVPLQRVGGPLAKITSTGIAKRIAESGLPLADVAWTQPLSKEAVAKSAVRCCLEGAEGLEGGGKGKDSGDALVFKVQDIEELVSSPQL